MNKWEDAEWVGGGRAQCKVSREMVPCLFQLCLHVHVHHPQGSHLLQKVTGLVEAKSSQPVLWRTFEMLTHPRQRQLLGS